MINGDFKGGTMSSVQNAPEYLHKERMRMVSGVARIQEYGGLTVIVHNDAFKRFCHSEFLA